MLETWAPLTGYAGVYEVSTEGGFRRVARVSKHPVYGDMNIRAKSAVLTPSKSNGYVYVGLFDGVRQVRKRLHILILSSFVQKPFAGAQVRHLNGVRADNRLANLAWGSALDNATDRDKHGTTAHGGSHGSNKLSDEQVRLILRSTDTALALSRVFGVSRSLIYKIRNRRCWKSL